MDGGYGPNNQTLVIGKNDAMKSFYTQLRVKLIIFIDEKCWQYDPSKLRVFFYVCP